MRITADLVEESPQFVNTLREREIDIRGHKIQHIENLGATVDQFDTIDLSDNEVSLLGGFPLLKKLTSLFLNNNKITKVEPDLPDYLPSLTELVLTNNSIENFADIDDIAKMPTLRRLSLLRNPVSYKQNYRAYVIHKIPRLILLDFKKVKYKERLEAKEIFQGEAGTHLKVDTMENCTVKRRAPQSDINAKHVIKIKEAIMKASTLDEVRRLEALLQTGCIPSEN